MKHKKPESSEAARGRWESFKAILVAVTLALVFRSFLFEPFHIPSGSMKGNLLIGDYIFVTKFSYGYSRYSFPFGPKLFEGRTGSDHRPLRGDVVVFRLPSNPHIDYIKRVMGLPGDRIQVTDGVVFINGKALPKARVDEWWDEDESKSIDRYEETLPEGKKIFVLDERPDGMVDNTPEYIVPPGHYFMMGDNRDNSTDSRYMLGGVGFVPEENLVGRADIIVLSMKNLLHPRWSRFFTFIN